MTDDELASFLDGSQGVAGLDLARELVATRVLLGRAQTQCQALQVTCEQYAAVAETAMQEGATARARLESLCGALANMSAEVREYLGVPR